MTLPLPPAHYNTKVRGRGEAFLRRNPTPSSDAWDKHAYWREIHDDLYQGHGGICVYCASWTPRRLSPASGIDHTSVDHYLPKSTSPLRAYDWTNFRLCRTRLNNRKDVFTDVLDPCCIADGYFMLEFTTFLIKPTPGLQAEIETGVRSTIDRLQLNIDNAYVNERITVIREYSLGQLSFSQVESKYPFIAQQLQAQDFDTRYRTRMQEYFRSQTTFP